jgi:uncharacterized protein YaiL (DUF2058 family)
VSQSLRDQLIQAGLVSEKQARAANPPARAPQVSRKKPPPLAENQLLVQRAQAEKAARDQELNRRQQEKAERKARQAQVRQLVEQNRVPAVEGDDFYNFVDHGKIKRIAVTPAMREQLNRSELAIVRYDRQYALVPATAVERIRERDGSAIMALAATPTAEVAAYKEYVVPDDLMW